MKSDELAKILSESGEEYVNIVMEEYIKNSISKDILGENEEDTFHEDRQSEEN